MKTKRTREIDGEFYDIGDHPTEFGFMATRVSDGATSRAYSQLADLAYDLQNDPSECDWSKSDETNN